MSLKAYVDAVIPEPFVVLGVPLRPYSLGHYLLMVKFDCAFASDNSDAMASIEDLLLGVAICSRTYEDFLEWIHNPQDVEDWMKEWGKVVMDMSKNDIDFNMFEKFLLFKEYIQNGSQLPHFWTNDEKAGEPKTSGAHWCQSLLSVLTSECGQTEQQVMNQPLCKSWSDYLKFAEKGGMITLVSDEEEAEMNKEKNTTP